MKMTVFPYPDSIFNLKVAFDSRDCDINRFDCI